MKHLLVLILALPTPSFGAQAAPVKAEPPAVSRIIIPGAPLDNTEKSVILPSDSAPDLSVKTPGIIIPKPQVIEAPAPKIVVAVRPLSEEETAVDKLPSQNDLKRMAASLSPSDNAANPDEEKRRAMALNSAFDGMLAPEASDWDEISTEFARVPLAPSLPRVETASRSLLARLLPRFYRRIPVASVYDNGERPATGHTWTSERGHRIELAPTRADSQGTVLSSFGQPDSLRIQQKIEHLMGYAHEYAHVLFDSAVGRKENYPPHSVYTAMTEGFAVSVEQLLITRLLDQASTLGLTPRDALDLSAMARAREQWLAAQDNHYSEGMLSWRKAYAEGGEQGLLAFLSSLCARRMIPASRADPAYQLSADDPKLLSAYLGDDETSTARRGLEAFGKAARGETLDDEEKREAELVIEQAGASSWRRLFERTLLTDKSIKEPRPAVKTARWWEEAPEPLIPVEPVFALARLSRSAATELARFLAEIIQSPGGAARLFKRPGPNARTDALIAGAEMLPWNEPDHRAWMDGLMRWLVGAN